MSIDKYHVGFKILKQQGISEQGFGRLVYKFKRIAEKPSFHDQFKKITNHYKRVRYRLDIMLQSACMVINPITVYSYVFNLNYTMVGQA